MRASTFFSTSPSSERIACPRSMPRPKRAQRTVSPAWSPGPSPAATPRRKAIRPWGGSTATPPRNVPQVTPGEEQHILHIMRQLATGFILVLWFSAFSGSAGYAQGKKPCDFITKSDAESILGLTVQLGKDNPYNCQFVEPNFTGALPP